MSLLAETRKAPYIIKKSTEPRTGTYKDHSLSFPYEIIGNGEPTTFIIRGWLGYHRNVVRPLALAESGSHPASEGFLAFAKSHPEEADQLRQTIENKKQGSALLATVPGLGEADPIEDPSFNNIAEGLNGLSRKLGLKKPKLVGLSMGGLLALMMAAGAPEDTGLVEIQGTPYSRENMRGAAHLGYKLFIDTGFYHVIEKTGKTKALLAKMLTQHICSDRAAKAAMQATIYAADNKTIFSTLKQMGEGLTRDELSSVRSPVLRIDGEHDELVTPGAGIMLSPNKQVDDVQVRGYGHGLPCEFPESVAILSQLHDEKIASGRAHLRVPDWLRPIVIYNKQAA